MTATKPQRRGRGRARASRAIVALAWIVGASVACASGRSSDRADVAPDGARTPCLGCHAPEYRASKHHAADTPARCSVCHAQSEWHPMASIEHPWALTGKHEKAKCVGCHAGKPPAYVGTTKACAVCHHDKWDEQHDLAADHKLCGRCHSTKAWSDWPERPADEEDRGAKGDGGDDTAASAASVSASIAPIAPSATPSASATTRPTPPRPTPPHRPTTPTPTPTPTPTATPTTTPTPTPTTTPTDVPGPDVITTPSRRRRR